MKKIVIASDSFKGSASSQEVADSIKKGILQVFPTCETVCLCVADGGEGLTEALNQRLNGHRIKCRVHNPLSELSDAEYLLSDDGETAVIETASASGLSLIPVHKRNPMKTTSFGTGELIRDAILRGCRTILLGIGGSGTNDAGTGMLQALGFRFKDKNGIGLKYGGEILEQIVSIDESEVLPELRSCRFTVICDVNNPLFGENGAAYVYAPQKGASKEQVFLLDKGLRNFAHVIERTKHIKIDNIPGSGAAGGIGAACLAFLPARLQPGIKTVLEMIGFEKQIAGADLIITGEGKLDRQTVMGKTASGILEVAQRQNIPVIALGGCIENRERLNQAGFLAVFSIQPFPVTLEKAMKKEFTLHNITETTVQIIRILSI